MVIMKLNLDTNFNPIVNADFGVSQDTITADLFQFSGGEWHIKVNKFHHYKDYKVVITNRLKDGNDLLKVFIAKDALERMGVKRFELIMPYIPYARQDRQCAERESFSLKVFANLLNTAKFDKVTVYDAHSDVAPAIIENCVNISNTRFVRQIIPELKLDKFLYLVSPDSGANKKMNILYSKMITHFGINYPIGLIKCDKRRNTQDGTIDGFEVFCDDIKGANCLIVDDIIDGGATFIGIAKELKKKNAGNIYLFCTHGIFSKGFEDLAKHFELIFTTNSIKDISNNIVIQYKI